MITYWGDNYINYYAKLLISLAEGGLKFVILLRENKHVKKTFNIKTYFNNLATFKNIFAFHKHIWMEKQWMKIILMVGMKEDQNNFITLLAHLFLKMVYNKEIEYFIQF